MAMAEGVGKFRENKKLHFFFWDFSWGYFFPSRVSQWTIFYKSGLNLQGLKKVFLIFWNFFLQHTITAADSLGKQRFGDK